MRKFLMTALVLSGCCLSSLMGQRPTPVINSQHQHAHDAVTPVPAHRTCGSMDVYESKIQNDPSLRQEVEASQRAYQEWLNNGGQQSQRAVITIPVVVHIIYNSNANAVSAARVQSQIDVLNEDYRRQNADTTNTPAVFQSVATDTEIEFCLATQDPNGSPTSGINRIQNNQATHNMNNEAALKSIIQWDPTKYLNVWVVETINGGQVLGYAAFPTQLAGSPQLDGVVMGAQFFGRNSPGAPYNLGRTMTHEVGHWLGLFHTFQGGCAGNSANTCNSGGDLVCDTPPVSSPNFSCPSNSPNTCTETPTDQPDQYMNYMDYVDDDCMNMFTEGQNTRMQFFLSNQRIGLQTSQGCGGGSPPTTCGFDTIGYPIPGSQVIYTVPAAAGGGYVSGQNGYNDIAKAQYYSNTTGITEIDGIYLEVGVISAASANSTFDAHIWSDNNGSPDQIIATETFTYTQALQDSGRVRALFTNPVSVSGAFYVGIDIDYAAGDTIILLTNTDGDQSTATAWEQWSTNDWYAYDDANSWEIVVGHAAYPIVGQLQASVSPSNPIINPGGSVVLIGAISGQSGITYSWSPSAGLSCTTCANPTASPGTTTTYTLTVSDPAANCTSAVDVTVTVQPVGIEDELFGGDIVVAPNPSNGLFQLRFDQGEVADLDILVFNNLGQAVYKEELKDFYGSYRKGIDLSQLPAGMYHLRISDGLNSYRQKLVFD